MRFRTSYSKALNYLIIITGVYLLVISFTSGHYWAILMILICVSPYTITYTIENGNLLIKSIIYKKEIAISDITSIKSTDSGLAAPAAGPLSERIEIVYNHQKSIIVTPRNRREFICKLINQNPRIELSIEELNIRD